MDILANGLAINRRPVVLLPPNGAQTNATPYPKGSAPHPTMAPRTADPAKHEARKEAILDAGLAVLWEKGYHGTGVQDLVAAAGIPKGSFYFYFDSKEAFAVEALRRYLGLDRGAVPAVLANRDVRPLERIKAFIREQITGVSTGEESLRRGCLLTNLQTEMAGQNEAIRRAVLEGEAYRRRIIADALREAIAEGELDTEEDPEDLAEFLENTVRGAVSAAKASRNDRPLRLVERYLFGKLLVP
jgi:TetR/AcrR family transcriptional repressor of nem operon